MSIKDLLRIPQAYSALMWLLGGPRARRKHVSEHIRPFPGCSILDIGCGPADILDFLPADINYVGVDYEASYIQSAKNKYGHRGEFICRSVDDLVAEGGKRFDIVLATGLLHHLNDEQCLHLLEVARQGLKDDGRLITLDGCFRRGQNPIARLILKNDRGQFVRQQEQYVALAEKAFPYVRGTLHENYLRVPYSLFIMSSSKVPLGHTTGEYNKALIGGANKRMTGALRR